MGGRDLILDADQTPTYDEIVHYADGAARVLWQNINSYIQQMYKASPKITYSKCSGKPGWNVKYQKSGKSICTLYPEKKGFVVLVVVTLDLVPIIEVMSEKFETAILEIMRTAKPFNGTLWLMIPVADKAMLESVKQILSLKHKGVANV